jgi:transcriptional regulator
MYLRPAHAETDVSNLKAFIRDNPLGIFTTSLSSPNFPLLQSTHIPWVYDFDIDNDDQLGVIRGHMARNNPHAKALIEAVNSSSPSSNAIDTEVMLLFNAPHNSYVTPQFYVETKPSTGKVVPTYNYAAAQIYGKATIYADASSEAASQFIMQQVDDLTKQEEGRDAEKKPWKVSDAPSSYVDILSKAIIGISIEVTRLEGKYKMSQEMGVKDRVGVVNGFEAMGTENGMAIAKMVRERGQ